MGDENPTSSRFNFFLIKTIANPMHSPIRTTIKTDSNEKTIDRGRRNGGVSKTGSRGFLLFETRHNLSMVMSTNKSDVNSYGVEHLGASRLFLLENKKGNRRPYLAVFSL